jgi:D-alanyl-D-alanine carboxypeptidase
VNGAGSPPFRQAHPFGRLRRTLSGVEGLAGDGRLGIASKLASYDLNGDGLDEIACEQPSCLDRPESSLSARKCGFRCIDTAQAVTQSIRVTTIQPPPQYRDRKPCFREPCDLISIGQDQCGRDAFLVPDAAQAWLAMRTRAGESEVILLVVSAFRSIARQEEIVRKKLQLGLSWDEILKVNAYPGFSEHHTGTAIDIATPDCPQLIEAFERTSAFRWLEQNAGQFGFKMTYPRGNSLGISYEPWHWRWHKPEGQAAISQQERLMLSARR